MKYCQTSNPQIAQKVTVKQDIASSLVGEGLCNVKTSTSFFESLWNKLLFGSSQLLQF